ncbi:peptidyl-prolyl cis-trans isomerase [Striga asiatica]|uniref:peptidylprolyl isomerase n=1 Tax=Striga asiatica TaxID=4170 RepID=A0A5A7PND9_STRAF|nr:peptidyl-prolyl cis-trans isomerase [Striga asiatica]
MKMAALSSLQLPLCCNFGRINNSFNRQRVYGFNIVAGIKSLASTIRPLIRTNELDWDECGSFVGRRNFFGLGLIGVSTLLRSSTFVEAAGLPPEEKPRLCDDTFVLSCGMSRNRFLLNENEKSRKCAEVIVAMVECDGKEPRNDTRKVFSSVLRSFICCPNRTNLFKSILILEAVPMVTTESGLQYKDINVGNGPSPPVGFQVAANYVAMVPSGQIFDSSLEKGQLYIFRVGSGQVIKGLDEGILSMKVGGKRRLYIPGPLAFPKGLASAPGRPRVAANSPVVFDVSLEYIPGLEDDE